MLEIQNRLEKFFVEAARNGQASETVEIDGQKAYRFDGPFTSSALSVDEVGYLADCVGVILAPDLTPGGQYPLECEIYMGTELLDKRHSNNPSVVERFINSMKASFEGRWGEIVSGEYIYYFIPRPSSELGRVFSSWFPEDWSSRAPAKN